MSKTVVLVAGILVAAGAAAAVSAPSLRGQRHGTLLDDLADGLGRATHQIPRCVGEVSVGPALAARKDASPNRPERGEPPGKRTNSNCPDGAGSL